MQTIESLTPLIDKYKLFLFDQFGVLHNGEKPYHGMQQTLRELKQHGRHVAVISNSGKRAKVNAERIASFGYGDDLIDRVYTSGELAWLRLKELTRQHTEDTPLSVYYFGNDDDRSALSGMPITEIQNPAHADLIIIGGMGTPIRTEASYKHFLQEAASGSVPAYCTNPDLLSFYKNGSVKMGPGRIANIYRELGGKCSYFGKPHPEIYNHILSDFGITASQTICIGDSVEHDILGASRAGCSSVLVRTGIHENLDETGLLALYRKTATQPDYVLRKA